MARVLIIEDCARARRLLVRILGVQGHEICIASDGHEGLCALSGDSARPPSFDIVITDIFMPQGDGFEMIRAAIRLPRPPLLAGHHRFAAGLPADGLGARCGPRAG